MVEAMEARQPPARHVIKEQVHLARRGEERTVKQFKVDFFQLFALSTQI
jgi:hypothetical protein